jgi:outer membrane protein assembly complex protein YaeT
VTPPAHFGQKIAAIYFEPAKQPLTRDQLGLSLQIRPGDVLGEVELSKAIERLWATGRYRDIVVAAEGTAQGVELTFRTAPAFFVSGVWVLGVPEPPNPAQLTNSTRLNLGEPFDERLLPAAADNLLAVLRANGFQTAKVVYDTMEKAETEEMSIRFVVDPGPRARFTTPVFQGNPVLPEKKLIKLSSWQKWYGLRGWKDATDARVQRGLEKMQDEYRKAGYLRATVKLNALEYDAEAKTEKPRLTIEAGPRVKVEATGTKVSAGEMRRLIPIYQERTVDRELLVEGQNNLVAKFRNAGYFDAKVSYSQPQSDGGADQTITYRIERGPRYKLVKVMVGGNRYFDEATVRERLNIIPARRPRFPKGQFSPDLLEQDRGGLEALYRANGFRDVKVKAEVERNWEGKATDVAVRLQIEEGPQWFVADVELTGVDLKLVETIQGLVSSTPGQPYSIAAVAADRDAILNWYFNNGYPDATFDATVKPAETANMMALKYALREGRRNFVRDVRVNGLQATRPSLVAKRIMLRAGAPLSQSEMVESQRRLYDLGIFAKVDVAVQNPQGRESSKFVLMQVEEAKKYSLNLGFGAQLGNIGGGNSFNAPAGTAGFSPRGQIGVTRSNLFGIAHTANATLRVSNIQQRMVLSYLAPQIHGNDKLNLTFSSLLDRSLDVRTFASQRTESSVQLGQKVSRTINVQYRATARFVFIDEESLKIDPSLIPVYSQPVKTIAVSSSIIQDRRDDPILSHSGYYNTLDVGYAPRFAESSTNFTRLVARNSTYHPVTREVTFARSTSFGWLYNLSENPVPLPENFYAGGTSTHRGFPDNQAGPRDLVTGFPIGGQSFLFFQHELRFPLYGNNLGAVLFHDMGNVYSTFGDISFRYKQKDRQDFNYMVQAVGLGFRIKTPVGPLRLDFAYAPNSPRFVGFEGDYNDLINGTGTYNVPQRVNPFQWHFSIGQTF